MQARGIALALLLALSCTGALAQSTAELQVFSDSLTRRLQQRTGVRAAEARLRSVVRLGGRADFYFSSSIGEFPWHEEDLQWLRDTLQQQIGEWTPVGKCFCGRIDMDDFAVPVQGNDGKPSASYLFRSDDPNPSRRNIVEKAAARRFKKGLSGRHIALWQSHGRFYDEGSGRWCWQRPPLFRTVEDLYTQSYVLPFLMPMLENAGAYVLTPRERDTQIREIVCDADPDYGESSDPRGRTHGRYAESGSWRDGPAGFADRQEHYDFGQNPFRMGGTRLCTVRKGDAKAVWTPVIQEKGDYAVYISYPALPSSSRAARYTVRHAGGESVFYVDQRRGGGTWMYLGTFSFAPGTQGCVILDNGVPEGYSVPEGSVVGADAVKFGGGIGKTLRGGSVSGLPAFAEGASYWMNWAGLDTSSVRKPANDYVNDYAGRGAWVRHLKEERGVPFDLSLAFHSDAGTTPDSTTVGTLAIYSLINEHRRSFPDGSDRMKSRLLAQQVQDQVCSDIRASFEPEWNRRGLWNKGYNESRTPEVPAMILELLSHQNFADMKYGLDPTFRFQVSRAVYKGILKFLSELYGCTYAVQPLPVHNFSVLPGGDGNACLRWSPTPDPLEPTAVTKGYTVYTRIDGGAFDTGRELTDSTLLLPIEAGHVYSYKIEAWGDGGRSFPSEILSIGIAPGDTAAPLRIVNHFTRVSGPAVIEKGDDYALFDDRLDSGVPWGQDISFIGEMYGSDRRLPWVSNEDAGFGASWTDQAGSIIAGNRFDYCAVHGAAALACGHSFCSLSEEAFLRDTDSTAAVIDLICGKQASTRVGRGTTGLRFELFPAPLRRKLTALRARGGRLLISGANIASDIWRPLTETGRSEAETDALKRFAADTLGYRFATAFGSRSGSIDGMAYWNRPNPWEYCVENPDGLRAVSGGRTLLRYDDSGAGAAVRFIDGKSGYRIFAAGFPLEVLKNEEDRQKVMEMALGWLYR
ncbi:MAG: N-acetylmuramoyl-L-alanine amidase [Bacteroidales bacterium]|nr:N-acetylmuramoyl-L-alanine amidase [Bacteroidales bacterium]